MSSPTPPTPESATSRATGASGETPCAEPSLTVMALTLSEIAARVGGTVHGDGSVVITGAKGIGEVQSGEISYVGASKYETTARESQAAALITPNDRLGDVKPLLLHDNPSYLFSRVLRLFHPEPAPIPGCHPTAVIASTVRLGERVSIGPGVVIEDDVVLADDVVIDAQCHIGRGCRVGAGTRLEPQVVLRSNVHLGSRCLIHSGTVIGADGFGFVFYQGRHHKIPQVGGVRMGDDCDIGANVCIDRGTTGHTVIGHNVIVDNLVQIAHNVRIGDGSIIVSQTGIAGSTTIGRFVTLAGQTGVADHVEIGDGVVAAARAGVDRNLKAGEVVLGYPPSDPMAHKRQMVALTRLPELLRTVRDLEQRLRSLEEAGSAQKAAAGTDQPADGPPDRSSQNRS